ncbi:MAG TPA: alanine--tRNA ligase, partial [Acidimicrobiales bacterium]|nr:alanine--tRNA ligase [Acidimicrobiales bacterium]
IQKCVRAGGKHNDLDAIGRSLRHLSFFEMLGNFSFGDYFKLEAITWAWELVTERLGMDGDRIWITVHTTDDEAEAIWRDVVGFPGERIQRLGEENFWEMGEVGPCGRSSEMFWDYGPSAGPEGGPANPAAEERYVEFWNLVFQQYFRQPSGELTDLPRKNVDTGAGLERMLAVLNGTRSFYETDVLAALVDAAESITGVRAGRDASSDIALRLLADHTRTMTFLVADGVIPSNEDRGYVLRRIIRRAVRYAYLLGVEKMATPTLVDRCVETMGDAYPDLRAKHDFIVRITSREEERFRQTLKSGSGILEAELRELHEGGAVPGAVSFQLHDTYGFPIEVTQEIAAERGFTVDMEGFAELMEAQRTRARQAAKKGEVFANHELYQELLEQFGPTEFVGRESNTTDAQVLAVIGDELYLDRTPFYAESGGQIGDTGEIVGADGRARVVDTTYALPGLVRHKIERVSGSIEAGHAVAATIDIARRDAIRRNHTGTHLLHWAMRKVLGDHVKQQGSWVGPDRLRFDFSHYEALTPEQIQAIEDLANAEVLDNAPVRHFETTKEHAEHLGAIAFFGDKYGDIVRVLEAGRNSIELCGGTHVRALGDIGPLKIVSEGSIGANLRRIEAVSGFAPIERLRHEEQQLKRAAELVGVSADELVPGIEKRLAELKELQIELRNLRRQLAVNGASELAVQAVDGVVVARRDGMERDDLRELAVAVRDQPGVRAVALGAAPAGGGAALVVAVRKDSGVHAGNVLATATKVIQGGG